MSKKQILSQIYEYRPIWDQLPSISNEQPCHPSFFEVSVRDESKCHVHFWGELKSALEDFKKLNEAIEAALGKSGSQQTLNDLKKVEDEIKKIDARKIEVQGELIVLQDNAQQEEEKRKSFSSQYDSVIEKYKKIAALLEQNKSHWEKYDIGVEGLMDDPKIELDDLESITGELQKDLTPDQSIKKFDEALMKFPKALTDFETAVSDAYTKLASFIGAPVSQEEIDLKFEELSGATEPVEKSFGEEKESLQVLTHDPLSLTEKQIKILTATTLAESGYGRVDMKDIAWVYRNRIVADGFDPGRDWLGMRGSSAYQFKHDNYKLWLTALGDDTYRDHPARDGWVIDLPNGKRRQAKTVGEFVDQNKGFRQHTLPKVEIVYKFVKETVLPGPVPEELRGFKRQGYWRDMQLDKFEWWIARRYLYLWKTGVVDGRYMHVVGTGSDTTFLFNGGAIETYFNNLGITKDNYTDDTQMKKIDKDYKDHKPDLNTDGFIYIGGKKVIRTRQ